MIELPLKFDQHRKSVKDRLTFCLKYSLIIDVEGEKI
jgi:hypothetical protein